MPRNSGINTSSSKKRIYGSGARQVILNVYLHKAEKNSGKEQKISESELLAKVAKIVGSSYDTVRQIVQNYKAGIPMKTPNKKRKRPKPARDSVDSFSKEAIARYIYQEASKGRRLSVKDILQYVRQNYDIFLFRGSHSTLYRVIKEMGFFWRKGDQSCHLRETSEIIVKRLYFLADYMKNKKSENPKPVVYLDETWIFMNGSSTYSWIQPGTSKGVIKRPAEGRRLVVVHAGTRDGFVPGAGLIFATDLKTGQDYHGAMNSTTFESWVEKQLIPGIRNLGSSIIVMDNASYHSRQLERNPTTKWRKAELIEWLTQHGVRVPEAANKTSLAALAKELCPKKKRYVVDEMLAAEGHSVLRLPPYHCMFNPIELVWATLKGYYNKTVCERPGQGIERTKSVWKEATDQVTSEMWGNSVKHTEKIIEEYYEKEAVDEDAAEVVVNLSSDSASDTEEDLSEEEDDLGPIEPLPGSSNIH